MRSLLYSIAAASLLAAAGCDTVEAPALDPDVVVEAYLVAGEPLGDVRLTRTIPIDGVFEADSLGVRDAEVRIELLRPNGDVEEVYALRPVPLERGVYRPATPPIVQPLRTYRLIANVAQPSARVASMTTVPGTFRVLSVTSDTVVYRSNAPLMAYLSRSFYPGRQSVFVLTTVALQATVSRLTPLAKARYDDGNVTITGLRESVSPLLNEENFDRARDGSLRVQYPWLGLNFYGRNEVILYALDDNLRDFIRSQTVQQGGSTLPPGEIPNVLDRIDGGRGIFGSVARASVEFVVLRSPDATN